MSTELTLSAIACREVGAELSIEPKWIEKRFTQLKSELRAPFPVNANLFDWLFQSTQQKPKAALSRFFGFEKWEEQYITTNEGNPFESTLKLGEKKFVASHEKKETAVERVMQSALSFLVQDHPVHFNRFRPSYIPSSSFSSESLKQADPVDHLVRLLGRENFYISVSKSNFMPADPMLVDSSETDFMEVDTIEVQMHLKAPERFPGENWKSTVVATGTATNPLSARDQAAKAFSKLSGEVESLRNYPEMTKKRNLDIHSSAPNLCEANIKLKEHLIEFPDDPDAKRSLKIVERDQAAEAYLKIAARDQAAKAYLENLDFQAKRYFIDLSRACLKSCLPDSLADLAAGYLDGDWLGYSKDAVYLTADVRPYVEEPEPKACVIS